MSETQQRKVYPSDQQQYPVTTVPERSGWVGMVVFGGVMLIMLGGFQVTEGLVAIFRDEYYLVTRGGLVLTMDYTAWGWTHLIIGLICIAAGFGILAGQMWARVLGVAVAVLSALANLFFLAAYPIWSTIIIALDVLVIYALVAHGREVKE